MNEHTHASHQAEVPPDLVSAVLAARHIAVLTGAGMSAESGIPTFRDALTGNWAKFDPSSLATESGFKRDPAFVWGWYEARRRDVRRVKPNAGHLALRDMAHFAWLQSLTIITQNVDDLHERAGSADVIHLHGNLFDSRCLACARPYVADPAPFEAEAVEAFTVDEDRPVEPPRCRRCNGRVRPGVVWFDELLPPWEFAAAIKHVEMADLVLLVGSSGAVYPAACLPDMAEERGCEIWVIDPAEGVATGARRAWQSTAAVALPALVAKCARSISTAQD